MFHGSEMMEYQFMELEADFKGNDFMGLGWLFKEDREGLPLEMGQLPLSGNQPD